MDAESLKNSVSATLQEKFSLASMHFGQVIHISEIDALIQQIKGVAKVNLNYLYDSEKNERLSNLILKVKKNFAISSEEVKLKLETILNKPLSVA